MFSDFELQWKNIGVNKTNQSIKNTGVYKTKQSIGILIRHVLILRGQGLFKMTKIDDFYEFCFCPQNITSTQISTRMFDIYLSIFSKSVY